MKIVILRTSSEPQPDGGGEEEGDEGCPDEDVPCPFRDVGPGDFDRDGDFLGDLDDFLFFGKLGGDGEGGALVLDGVAEVSGGEGGGRGCKGGLDGGRRVGRGDDDGLDRKRSGYDGVADGHGACDGRRVVDGDSDYARAARCGHERCEEGICKDFSHCEISGICTILQLVVQ